MNENKKTFWHFLKENTIEIPIIQRDYAQGREGKEYLRRNFLSNIKDALDGKLPHGEEVLKLDYVYGSREGGKLQPLDGQQRLTTLWLLHWYIAYKANKLTDEVKKRLKNFTYETRISSREFCEKLASFDTPQPNGIGIVEHIKNQTWFYSVWQQDPTIESMLRMLSGTKINDKQGEDIIDGLEELFERVNQEDFVEYWNRLINEAPIVFYYLPLEDFGLSDDLYVKMNARGKQLTPFENFKADLINYMRRRKEEEKNTTENQWENLLNPKDGIPIMMDTDWLNGIFWKNKSSDNKVDEIYYAFINRFFWNALVTAKKQGTNEYILHVGRGKLPNGEETNTIENNNLSYVYLNQDDYSKYADLVPYKYYEDEDDKNGKEIHIDFFTDLRKVLDNYLAYNRTIPCAKWLDGFEFIPKYNDSQGITDINQIQRIIFFAICKYFKEGRAENTPMERWMRVVCNLVSGKDENNMPQIRSIEAVRTAIGHIDKLNSHRVYESLIDVKTWEGDNTAFGRRWREEKDKAKQILEDDTNTWEEKIKEAEEYAFFNGSIRFLFYDANGHPNWTDFDTKFGNAKKYFKAGCELGETCCLNDDNAELMKTLMGSIKKDKLDNVLWWCHQTFNNESKSWYFYLMNPNIVDSINEFMLGKGKVEDCVDDEKDVNQHILYLLSKTKLLDVVMKKIPKAWMRDNYYKAFYPPYHPQETILLNAYQRDKFLINTENIKVDENAIIDEESLLLYGLDILFDYNGEHFLWYRDGYVYLMEKEKPREFKIKGAISEETEDNYYRFDANGLETQKILEKLDEIIKETKNLCLIQDDSVG